MNLLGTLLGWVMRLIYNVVHSYGMTILIFTLLVKLCTLPQTYKQQVNQHRIGLLSSKIEKLKKSFANNPTRFQEEQNKLYTQEGINPSQGCLGTFLMLFVLLGVYSVVMSPLTYILGLKTEVSEAKTLLQAWLTTNNIVDKTMNGRPELTIIKYVRSNPEIFSSLGGDFIDKVGSFEYTFLGFDLGATPTLSPDKWTASAVILASLPIIAFILNIVMTFVSQRHSKKINPSQASMGGMMNAMLYLTPLMSLWLGYSFPAGVNFYWIINSGVSLLMTLAIYAYLTPARMKGINEKEKEKQLAKGPGWMQRMMEASTAMANEQQNMGRGNGDPTADGDDGMSRKERAEYDRKLIEAARRRAALKYGEAIPESDNAEDTES